MKRDTISREEYVYGSSVPARQREYERPRIKTVHKAQPGVSVNLPFLLMLTAALVMSIVLCCRYLMVQSSINTRIKNIEKYESQLEDLKNENDALEIRIKTAVNLEEVYKVATEDLGMVYADKNQVIRYKKTESEYVVQNEDVPKGQ